MTRSLTWTGFAGVARAGTASVTLGRKPDALPAEAVIATYTDGVGRCAEPVGINGEPVWRDMTEAECAAVETYLSECAAAFGGSTVEHAVDASGLYLGIVPLGQGALRVPGPPPGEGYLWFRGAWVRQFTLEECIQLALEDIDAAAGAARMKYITDVPGQQATYMLKEEQARAFVAAPTSTPGPYLQAEADAMAVAPLAAAQEIIAIADQWSGTVGPAIERVRRAGKIATGAATTVADVATHRQAALDALAAF